MKKKPNPLGILRNSCYSSVCPRGPGRDRLCKKAGLEHLEFGYCGSQCWGGLEPGVLLPTTSSLFSNLIFPLILSVTILL